MGPTQVGRFAGLALGRPASDTYHDGGAGPQKDNAAAGSGSGYQYSRDVRIFGIDGGGNALGAHEGGYRSDLSQLRQNATAPVAGW